MQLEMFLQWALTAAGAGIVVYGGIELLGKIAPSPVPPGVKFYLAMALSFVVPIAAYGAEIALGLADLGAEGVFAAIAVGYMCSQGIHREREKLEPARP